jgi:YesN/AraC family two-component response regulator
MIKILIADDEGYQRTLLADIVDKRFGRGAEVRTAENGRLAVDAAALWAADVALMDIEMPGLSGIDAARQILAHCPACKIIFITAYSLFTYAHEAVKLGACDYILKPVDPDDVERAVRRAAAQGEAQRQLEAMAASEELLDSADGYDKTNLLMGKVKKYLQHNYMACDISLDSVSAMLNLSASYFSALFKRTFQVNFLDYLTELRMEAAKDLLRDPLRSTAEVAGMVGYESANYFTRAFKKKVGMTPTDYRRRAAPAQGNVIKLEALYMEQPKMKRVHPFRDALVLRKGHGKEAD